MKYSIPHLTQKLVWRKQTVHRGEQTRGRPGVKNNRFAKQRTWHVDDSLDDINVVT